MWTDVEARLTRSTVAEEPLDVKTFLRNVSRTLPTASS